MPLHAAPRLQFVNSIFLGKFSSLILKNCYSIEIYLLLAFDLLWRNGSLFATLMTFRQLRYFVAVCESGKINQAASELGISASAISSAIKELQVLAGVPLLERRDVKKFVARAQRRFVRASRIEEMIGAGEYCRIIPT